MTPSEAFALLGLDPHVDATTLRRVWRSLCARHHPDVGGDDATMARLNEAYARCRHEIERRDTTVSSPPPRVATSDPTRSAQTPQRPVRGRDRSLGISHVEHEIASFVIEALPVVAYEAVVVAGSWLGTLVDDDPPYLVEFVLDDPHPCWCRLELVPDAGSTTVSVTVSDDGARTPEDPGTGSELLYRVRDRWVTVLNDLPLPD